MKRFLIRCYPASWRERYGEEFEAILDVRPLGPFDVADILLGALDARLRMHGQHAGVNEERGFAMSLRIGGIAAILGGVSLAVSVVLGIGLVGGIDPTVAGVLFLAGAGLLLIALAGLSAFQARVHPVMSWAAFSIAALGILVCAIGIVGMQLDHEAFWVAFILGVFSVLAGSALFAVATYRTAALSRGAALVVGVASILTLVAGLAGDDLPPFVLISTTIGFAIGWAALGVDAILLDRPSIEARPA